jgi:RNA polymerase sigma-70 factor, ECF subfamily
VRLLADAAVAEMPPVPLWYRGSPDYGLFMRRVFEMRGTDWATRQLTANGQPALAAYAPEPAGGHRLHTLQVFSVADGLPLAWLYQMAISSTAMAPAAVHHD